MKPVVVSICAKCSDLCVTQLKDDKGEIIFEHDGYVPGFFPDEHYGDYVILDINLATGKILNWKKPSQAELNKWIKSNTRVEA